MSECLYTYFDSPVGRLYLACMEGHLTHLLFAEDSSDLPHKHASESTLPFSETICQLNAYFNGTLKSFDLPLKPKGTEFQLTAWKALLKIPYGETRTYAQQARIINKPKACRAVGSANGQNLVSLEAPATA